MDSPHRLSMLVELSRKGTNQYNYGSQISKGKGVVCNGHNDNMCRVRDPITKGLIPVSGIHSEQCVFSKFISNVSTRMRRENRQCFL